MEGVHKLLRPYPDVPVVRRAVEAALASHVGPVAVVVDPGSAAVGAAVSDLQVTVLDNPDAPGGASTSIARAARWGFARSEALLLTLGDEPDVQPGVIAALFDSWQGHRPPATRVRYRDRPGHPVLITREFLDQHPLRGDTGFGRALAELREYDLSVDADAPADLDTEADYRAALARLAH